jgi:ribonuclease T2
MLLAAALAAALNLIVLAPAAAQDRAGEFDYYALVLSWSPSYCATQGRSRPNEPQCSGDRPYSFVIHGLWPQYERGWPRSCETGERNWIPDNVINKMLDVMPSKRLIIHQYRKHGTCSGLAPEAYFRVSRQAYEAIQIPARFQTPQDYVTLSPAEIETEFLKANPGLEPDMISIDCKDRRLRELRICFTRDIKLRACGVNERQDKLCSSDKIVMPPARAGAFGDGGGQENGGYEDEEDEEYDYGGE